MRIGDVLVDRHLQLGDAEQISMREHLHGLAVPIEADRRIDQ